jgi:hypothetical protein
MRRKLFSAILVSSLLASAQADAGKGWKALLGWGDGKKEEKVVVHREEVRPADRPNGQQGHIIIPGKEHAPTGGSTTLYGHDSKPIEKHTPTPTPPVEKHTPTPTPTPPVEKHTPTPPPVVERHEIPTPKILKVQTEEKRGGGEKPSVPTYTPPARERRVIRRTEEFNLKKFPIRVAVMGRSDLSDVPGDVPSRTRKIGRAAAALGFPIVTGGGRGLPKEAERAAFEQQGETWALPPSSSVSEFEFGHGRDNTTSVLFPTGTGSGAGSIEREAPLAQVANIRAYTNGGPGTFGELIAGLHAPGVLAFLAGSGGVGGNAMEKILPYIGVPSDVRVVHEYDPHQLLDKATKAVRELEKKGVSTTPKTLYQPKSHQSATSWDERRGKNVVAVLADDNGMANAADQARILELSDLVMTQELNGKRALPILARAQGMPEQIAMRALSQHGIDSVVVTGAGGNNIVMHPKGGGPGRMKVVNTGKGDGVGQFGLHREVVEDADVIFVTSANYRNLSGLAFAMRQSGSPVIAVLELDSTGTNHLDEVLRTVDKRFASKVIYDRDPKRLMEKVNDKLKPSFSWKSSKDSGSGSSWGWSGGKDKDYRDDLPSWLRDRPKDSGSSSSSSGKKDKDRRDIELD